MEIAEMAAVEKHPTAMKKYHAKTSPRLSEILHYTTNKNTQSCLQTS